MAAMKPIQIRLSPTMIRTIAKLSAKTGLNRTNVMRLAITRLAESEGIAPPIGGPAQS